MTNNVRILLLLVPSFLFSPSFSSGAVHRPTHSTLEQLLELQPTDSKPMRILKKKLKRKLKRVSAKPTASPNTVKNGLWSVVLASIAIVLSLIGGNVEVGIIFILAGVAAILGLGLGIRGILRDDKIALSVIGVVLNAAVILFYLYLIFVVTLIILTCSA